MVELATLIQPRVYQIAAPFENGGLVNCYLIDAPRRTLIDTGTASVPQASLLPALKELGWDLSDLRIIEVTTNWAGPVAGRFLAKTLNPAELGGAYAGGAAFGGADAALHGGTPEQILEGAKKELPTLVCCGGGMSRSTTPAPTPQGSYTIIVVGNASGMQASTTVNLTVQ